MVLYIKKLRCVLCWDQGLNSVIGCFGDIIVLFIGIRYMYVSFFRGYPKEYKLLRSI